MHGMQRYIPSPLETSDLPSIQPIAHQVYNKQLWDRKVPGSCHGRTRINASHPIRSDEILISPIRLLTIHDCAGTLWSESILVNVATDTGYSLETEIEWFRRITRLIQEGDNKRAQASVHVERNVATESDARECSDVVNRAEGKIWGGTDNLARVSRIN